MDIIKNVIDDVCEIKLVGRLDTTTAPELETALKEVLEASTKNLQIDLEQLDYISSAGLRVLLSSQKIMSKQGEMKVINVSDTIMEIFDITGFTDILTIE